MVGARLREVLDRDARHVEPYGDATASFVVGGQLKGEAPRLFEVYAAGNFIEATARSPFVQIGETKYGKPILDRALGPQTTLAQAAKLALLSFDATMRSNISVGPPIDLLQYATDSFSIANLATLQDDNPYWVALRRDYSDGLAALVDRLPVPPTVG
jgi:putative proteasome-type protease